MFMCGLSGVLGGRIPQCPPRSRLQYSSIHYGCTRRAVSVTLWGVVRTYAPSRASVLVPLPLPAQHYGNPAALITALSLGSSVCSLMCAAAMLPASCMCPLLLFAWFMVVP